MSAFSNNLESNIVDHFLRNSAVTPAANLYLALYESTGPTDTGSYANETDYTGYLRRAITFTAIVTATGATSNVDVITFPANGGSAHTITYAAVFDSITAGAGTMLLHGALVANKTLDQNDVLSFAANALVLTVN